MLRDERLPSRRSIQEIMAWAKYSKEDSLQERFLFIQFLIVLYDF